MIRDREDSVTSAVVILVGHGSRDEQATRQFFQLSSRLAQRLAPIVVRPCSLEFQQPTITEAWEQLVDEGASRICVAPLLLFAAGHAKQDIPRIIAGCQARSGQVSVKFSRPLSRHRSMIELVGRRVAATAMQAAIDPARTALVMVGRGNRDPCAQADMRLLSEVVSRRCGLAHVFTAFYAMAQPSLSDLLRQVGQSGKFDCVIVHPHLLFTGRLFQAIADQVDRVAKEFAGVDFRLSPYLGPDPLVAEAIADRIRNSEVIDVGA